MLDTNDKVLPAERLATTYQTEFPTKFNPEPYKSDLVYQKAPALWKVDYVKDTIEKVRYFTVNLLVSVDIVMVDGMLYGPHAPWQCMSVCP